MSEEWLTDARKIPDDVMSFIRKMAVRAIEEKDYSPKTIAEVFGISLSSIYDGLERYRRGGYALLNTLTSPGAPGVITAEMDEWLQDTVINGNPMDFGYDTVLWTRTLLAELLNKEFGVEVAGSTVSLHLKNLDLSYQQPTYRPSEQDPQEVEYFLNEKFPRIQRLAKKLKADSGFEDEAGINLQTHAGKTWGRVGQPPEIRVTGQRGGYNTLSMVTAPGVMRFSVTDEKINSQKYIDFLKQLLQGRTRPLILIVDRVSFHSSKPVRDFVRSNRQKIRVFFLPRYSPELNPDEHLWNEIKSRKIGRKSIKTKLELKKKIYSALRSLQHNVEKIKSFFRLPDTKYASV